MFPETAGARPGKRNMMSLPNSDSSRLLPERKPSPTPTSSNNDPTPQAIPNMVRNERSLCAQRLRKICVKISESVLIIYEVHCTFNDRMIDISDRHAQGRVEAVMCWSHLPPDRWVPSKATQDDYRAVSAL